MDDYAIEIVQNIRETDEWKKDDSYCERIEISQSHSFLVAWIGEHCLIISQLSLDVIKRFIRALGRGFQMVFIKAAYYINQTEVHFTKEFHQLCIIQSGTNFFSIMILLIIKISTKTY